jgi:two-component SAPR family response regulator
MNVIIIDDEVLAIEVLEYMLITKDKINIIGKYTDPMLALSEIKKMDVDVVFLDLEMGSMHGTVCAELLYNEKPSLHIVFITAHSQYALEAFDLNVVDYLLKPVVPNRLNKTIEKLNKELLLSKIEPSITINPYKRLYIHTLGVYWVANSERNIPIKWRTKKVKELFAFLLHHKEHPVHRTLIIEELWPNTFMDKGAALLHTTVYQLRKLLKEIGLENSIQYSNEQYLLSIDEESDIKHFQYLLRLTTPKQEDINELFSLYEGDYFEQEEYSWVVYDQQKIRKAFLQYMENYITILSKESPYNIFLENCLSKMIQIDIYNDDYVYQLMSYYEKLGNKRKLSEVFLNYQNKLKEDLGLNIPYKMVKLYRKSVEL